MENIAKGTVAIIYALFGVFLFTLPIAFTFLRLANKLTQPATDDNAVVLGIVLYVVFWIVGGIFLSDAASLANSKK